LRLEAEATEAEATEAEATEAEATEVEIAFFFIFYKDCLVD
jgi:hypothetical protein